MMYHFRLVVITALGTCLLLLPSCKKDKVMPCPVPEPTKYELISGDYKVYDSLGNFLYDMNLNYIKGPFIDGFWRDSIYFTNLDGEFNFSKYQSNPSSELNITIGIHDTLYDSNGKRWKLLISPIEETYNNTFLNDTIKLRFRKTNINYWIEDAVPYFDGIIKQIAVKQH